ncbi:MAG TPA: MFS transporter [Gammaproteobacteria bacterium]|nr:MFS transporter [Gammaproteobacteria bacterium]
MRGRIPYFRLSGFYFFYFATLGVVMPYWAVYLQSLGFGGATIGELMAVLAATKIIAPNVWGWIADRSGRLVRVIRLAALLAPACFTATFFARDAASMALAMAGFGFFWNAALPQFEAVTLNHLGDQSHRYTRIRLWGSLGFITTVGSLGMVLEHARPAVILPVLMGLYGAIWLTSLTVPERVSHQRQQAQASLKRLLRKREVLALFGVCFLVQASHGPYYTFFTIYLQQLGYSSGVVGQLWALGVAAEIGIFLAMPRLMRGVGTRRLLLAALALSVVRWTGTATLAAYPAAVVAAQTLHLASFGINHAVAIDYIHRFFRGRNQGRGQALYSSIGFGAGVAAGSLASGYVWDLGGGPAIFGMAAALAAAALLLAALAIPPDAEQRVNEPALRTLPRAV